MGDVWLPVEDEPAFAVPAGFRPPRWLQKNERKHIPEHNWTWAQVIELSEGKEGDAWYHPELSHDEIRQIEMGALRDDFEIRAKRKPHQRVYWRRYLRVIGASKGQETEYVYVFYVNEGVCTVFRSLHKNFETKGLGYEAAKTTNPGAVISYNYLYEYLPFDWREEDLLFVRLPDGNTIGGVSPAIQRGVQNHAFGSLTKPD